MAASVLSVMLAGCDGAPGNPWGPRPPAATTQPVPAPLNLLLPTRIRFHGWTGGPRILDDKGQVRGFEVHLLAEDAFGHCTKAFGDWRFELYEEQPSGMDRRGRRLAVWDVSTFDPRANRDHWDELGRAYEFRLRWDQSPPVGAKLLLVAVFSSPFTERLFTEFAFVAGG